MSVVPVSLCLFLYVLFLVLSLFIFVFLSIRHSLSICLFVYLCLSVCTCVCLYLFVSVCLFLYVSVSLSVGPSILFSVPLSFHVYLCFHLPFIVGYSVHTQLWVEPAMMTNQDSTSPFKPLKKFNSKINEADVTSYTLTHCLSEIQLPAKSELHPKKLSNFSAKRNHLKSSKLQLPKVNVLLSKQKRKRQPFRSINVNSFNMNHEVESSLFIWDLFCHSSQAVQKKNQIIQGNLGKWKFLRALSEVPKKESLVKNVKKHFSPNKSV